MEPQAAVAAKIAAIYGELRPLQKDGQNTHFKYNYATEAAVKSALLPLLAKHKLVFRFVKFSGVERNGQKTTMTAHFEFICGESGAKEPVEMMVDVIEAQDKTFQKALTNAQKYALFGTFMLPTGDPADDSEHDSNEPKEQKPRREPVQAPPSESVNPEIAKLWEKMTGQKESVAAIMAWQPILGETVYRAVLAKYGLQFATDVKQKKVAMAIVADLYAADKAAQEMRAA